MPEQFGWPGIFTAINSKKDGKSSQSSVAART